MCAFRPNGLIVHPFGLTPGECARQLGASLGAAQDVAGTDVPALDDVPLVFKSEGAHTPRGERQRRSDGWLEREPASGKDAQSVAVAHQRNVLAGVQDQACTRENAGTSGSHR